ncbi:MULTISPECIES: GGDEF domain-containing protein [Streptomyces]|uniref:GGDEF domain-containing protein n=1 Tax=Streptomyces TaxID=1883 RepID=UPI0029AE23CC|nr:MULTISPECIES: GGDEF domain-containing protein [Streptomyces]MDX3066890.1 GGDEF domain-containing protein [Streptomyces sp. ND04-05B]MDX3519422.1 GGDEF domain-containing protein [Streptomyces scabiei]
MAAAPDSTRTAAARAEAAGLADGAAVAADARAAFDRARGDLAQDGVSPQRLRQTLALVVPAAEELWSQVADLTGQLAQARTCPVTGLPTRSAWTARAHRVIADGPTVVLLIDLDGFKPINDRFGHDAGDAILAHIGAGMRDWAEADGHAVGRLGGDEFVVAMADSPDLPARIARLSALLTAPVLYRGRTISVGASIGLARSGDLTGENLANPLSALLKTADAEMYAAKGRSRRGRRLARVVPRPVRHLLTRRAGR